MELEGDGDRPPADLHLHIAHGLRALARFGDVGEPHLDDRVRGKRGTVRVRDGTGHNPAPAREHPGAPRGRERGDEQCRDQTTRIRRACRTETCPHAGPPVGNVPVPSPEYRATITVTLSGAPRSSVFDT